MEGLRFSHVVQSTNMLTCFDGRSFQLHDILPSLEVQLGGKTIAIEVEVVDAPLDYNILLGRNWIYNMKVAALSLFLVFNFPLDGEIVIIDHPNIPI